MCLSMSVADLLERLLEQMTERPMSNIVQERRDKYNSPVVTVYWFCVVIQPV